jgi:hypothetical protein
VGLFFLLIALGAWNSKLDLSSGLCTLEGAPHKHKHQMYVVLLLLSLEPTKKKWTKVERIKNRGDELNQAIIHKYMDVQ